MSDYVRRRRPLIIRIGKKLRPLLNKILAEHSLIPNVPVFNTSIFPWIAELEKSAPEIQQEWQELTEHHNSEVGNAPSLRDISPDHAKIAHDKRWHSFFLQGYGVKAEENCAIMPKTAAAISKIPGLNSAFFSILEPGAVIPPHYGVTKGIVTCHLGIRVPKDRDNCWIDVEHERLLWTERKCILFDDTYLHCVKNNTDEHRIVLLMQVLRPEHGLGKFLQDAFMWIIRRSPFVKDAHKNFMTLKDKGEA